MNIKSLPLYFSVVALILLSTSYSHSQQTITITGSDLHDAAVFNNSRPGHEQSANTNYGSLPRISAVAWTNNGYSSSFRSLLYFNLRSIPAGSTVQSATLYLYSDPTKTGTSNAEGNSQLSGSNAFYLEKITAEWDEFTVTWNNQPSTTTTGRISVDASTSTTENRQINLTSIVQEWLNDPVTNNGLKMILQNEVHYRSRNYASTNHANGSLHPRLTITYTPPAQTFTNCGSPEPTESEVMALPWFGSETFLSNYSDSLDAAMNNAAMARVPGHIETPYLRVQVQFWIYRNNATTPGGNDPLPDERSIQRFLDDANSAARDNGLRLRFYTAGINFVDRPGAVVLDNIAEELSLANSFRNNNAVNVHIVDQGTAGVYNPLYNAIFMRRLSGTTDAEATTFTHEIGHFFGLLHTHSFAGILCLREPVTRGRKITACPNGSGYTVRCRFTGDLLCDTDADPDMSETGTYTAATCSWNGNGRRDFYGDLYRPHPRNYMAYGNRVNAADPCRNTFSREQTIVMHFFAFARQYRSAWLTNANNQFDRHEPDDAAVAARNIALNETQTHTFHTSGRPDNQDWLRFTYPAAGSLGNYQLVVTQTLASSAGTVQFFPENNPGTPLTGITSTTTGNVITYTIPCSILTRNTNYLVRIDRGGAGYREYDVQLRNTQVTPITISGSATTCSSNETYTLQGAPAGSTISWTRSSNLTYISGQGTSTYTVRANSPGAAWVQATITNGCTLVVRKDIQVSGAITGHTLLGTNGVCLGNDYRYEAVIPGGHQAHYTYTWTVPSGWTRVSQYQNILIARPYTNFGGGILGYTVNAGCGASSMSSLTVYEVSCFTSTMATMSTFPNPAESEVTIELQPDNDEITFGENSNKEIHSIVILDKSGQPLRELKLDKPEASVRLNIKDLQKDYYFLKVFDGTQWQTIRLLKK